MFNNVYPKIASFMRQNNVENSVERGRPQMKILRLRVACWIPKAINVHSEYVILIACPLQQWLDERTSNVTIYVHSPVMLYCILYLTHFNILRFDMSCQ